MTVQTSQIEKLIIFSMNVGVSGGRAISSINCSAASVPGYSCSHGRRPPWLPLQVNKLSLSGSTVRWQLMLGWMEQDLSKWDIPFLGKTLWNTCNPCCWRCLDILHWVSSGPRTGANQSYNILYTLYTGCLWHRLNELLSTQPGIIAVSPEFPTDFGRGRNP